VTLPTEIGERFGRHVLEAGRRRAEVAHCGVGCVVERALVTMRTGDAGMKGPERELVGGDGVAGVAAEAQLRIHRRELAPHRLLQRLRRQPLVACGNAKAVRRGVKADDALIESAILLEDPGLRLGTETPVDRHGDGAGAVGDFVDALSIVGFDGPGVRALAKGEAGVRREDRIGARQFDGVTHGGFRLHRLSPMTTAAVCSGRGRLSESSGICRCQHEEA
jgi:hypothetical protein